MRNTNNAIHTAIKTKQLQTGQPSTYLNIAGSLAFEMMSFIRPGETSRFCPPFELVIIGSHGAVVFECEVGDDWKVRHCGSTSRVRRSHFPATALLTDGSLRTRTFLIERAPHTLSQN